MEDSYGKKVFALIVTAAMLLSLAACGSADEHSSTGKSQNEQNAEDGTIAASYLFTDDVGRQVEIPSEITRIVPSAPLAQIILMAIAPKCLLVWQPNSIIIPMVLYQKICLKFPTLEAFMPDLT